MFPKLYELFFISLHVFFNTFNEGMPRNPVCNTHLIVSTMLILEDLQNEKFVQHGMDLQGR